MALKQEFTTTHPNAYAVLCAFDGLRVVRMTEVVLFDGQPVRAWTECGYKHKFDEEPWILLDTDEQRAQDVARQLRENFCPLRLR